jgi:hypothetical protein
MKEEKSIASFRFYFILKLGDAKVYRLQKKSEGIIDCSMDNFKSQV